MKAKLPKMVCMHDSGRINTTLVQAPRKKPETRFKLLLFSRKSLTCPIIPRKPPIRICDSRALINGGLAIKHPVTDSTSQGSAIFIRYQDQIYGYVNRCAHIGVELDWEGKVYHACRRPADVRASWRNLSTRHWSMCRWPLQERQIRPLRVEERVDGVYWLSQGAVVERPELESENTP